MGKRRGKGWKENASVSKGCRQMEKTTYHVRDALKYKINRNAGLPKFFKARPPNGCKK